MLKAHALVVEGFVAFFEGRHGAARRLLNKAQVLGEAEAAPWVLSEEEISLIDAAGQAHAVADIVDKGDDYVVEPSTYPLRFDCKSHLATLCSGWEQVRVLFHVPKQAKPARLRIGDKEFTLDDKAVATGNYTKVSSASCR